MNIQLYSKWGELPLADHYPGSPPSLLLPGAELKVARSDRKGYCYLFQQFKTKFFTIRYCCFYSITNDLLTVVTTAPGVTFRLGISHSHHVITKNLGNQVFHERGYNFFYDSNQVAEYPIGPGERFIFLDLIPENDYRHYLQYYFPAISALMEKAAEGTGGKLTLCNQVALAETWRWQEEMQDWCFNANRKSLDGDIIGNKLIENSIQSVKPAAKRGIALTLQENNRICDAAEMIRNSNEPFGIKMLAANTGLSAYKFNAGFKEIFGHPVMKHKFEEKMSYALRLVDCAGADLKQVATLLGYSHPRIFSKDFRKRFGYAPFEDNRHAQ
jgi:AraC-like DNA-binding protein